MNEQNLVGYVTARESDREVYCDFMDASTEETKNPPEPRMCRFALVRAKMSEDASASPPPRSRRPASPPRRCPARRPAAMLTPR
eukprot:COSAG06_NODE_182_length_20899_cov_89.175048_4_plen_84_part_00